MNLPWGWRHANNISTENEHIFTSAVPPEQKNAAEGVASFLGKVHSALFWFSLETA